MSGFFSLFYIKRVWYRCGCFLDQFKMAIKNKAFIVLCNTNYSLQWILLRCYVKEPESLLNFSGLSLKPQQFSCTSYLEDTLLTITRCYVKGLGSRRTLQEILYVKAPWASLNDGYLRSHYCYIFAKFKLKTVIKYTFMVHKINFARVKWYHQRAKIDWTAN